MLSWDNSMQFLMNSDMQRGGLSCDVVNGMGGGFVSCYCTDKGGGALNVCRCMLRTLP